jgi:lysine-specific demethylase 8
MPMLIWHYLEYTDHAMSFNLRFGRNKFGRFLCVDNFHRDCYIQCFASQLADTASCKHQYAAIINSVIEKYIEPSANLRDKVGEMRRFFKELCLQTFPEAHMEEYCPPEREQDEIDKIVQDIGPMRYIDPKMMAQTRPSGPIMPRQKQLIEEQALKCEYPSSVLQHLLTNKIGKSDIDTLTKGEAAQFISYLKSPGASWVL